MFYRTDVWSLGCLLFAWQFGYSPFECEFSDSSNGVRLVESSYSRVLAKWPRPKNPSVDDSVIIGICEWVLNINITDRYVSARSNQASLDTYHILSELTSS